MKRTEITLELIEAHLRELRSGHPASPNGNPLAWTDPQTGQTGQLSLDDLLYKLTWQAYARLRQAEGLDPTRPQNRAAALACIAQDSSSPNRELVAWSALYYRYLSGVYLHVEEMARAASVVPQQFRRRVNQGLTLLASQAQRLASTGEEHASENASPAPLPLPEFTALVGVRATFQLLAHMLHTPDGPRLVSLEGMGGIGKSALARAFISLPETSTRWSRIVWVSARQSALVEDGRISPVSDAIITLEDITARLCEQIGLPALSSQPLQKRLEGLKPPWPRRLT